MSSDYERMKSAMYLELKCQGNAHLISKKTLETLAKTAVETMWFIEEEKGTKG